MTQHKSTTASVLGNEQPSIAPSTGVRVRCGSLPDNPLTSSDVRFTPESDIVCDDGNVRFVPKAEVAVIRSVELIVQPDAHDVVSESHQNRKPPGPVLNL